MGKRGPKPKGKVRIEWSANFAYAIGLLASDGNLSKDGRHILFISKDLEQVKNFQNALGIQVQIGKKGRDGSKDRDYYLAQFSDVVFHQFLVDIGMMPNKSKTIANLQIPSEYFFDFLRGSFDGDGCFYSYLDPRWKSSFQFYTVFISASKDHIDWIRMELATHLEVLGHITKGGKKITYQLKYGKKESLKILKNMYYDGSALFLSRKRKKIETALKLAESYAQVEKLVDSLP